jgi:trans-2,3-dihydro-3-hydroxyanthranilate isomerase
MECIFSTQNNSAAYAALTTKRKQANLMQYFHADVFSTAPMTGNGLTVLLHDAPLPDDEMQALAQEFRQFETIFLQPLGGTRFRARIFTVEEELDFAGHPVLGAAAVLAEACCGNAFQLVLNNKTVKVQADRQSTVSFRATMAQGAPDFSGTVDGETRNALLRALSLTPESLEAGLPCTVISTGLPYLIVPVRREALPSAQIAVSTLEAQLAAVGAKFVYVLDCAAPEGRTWDNLGNVEDVATGSAAGPAAAYLWQQGLCPADAPILLRQGRFVGRPSEMEITRNTYGEIFVTGGVTLLARGELLL